MGKFILGILVIAVLVIGGFVFVTGKDRRQITETMKENVKKEIVDLIGKYEVQKKQVQLKIDACNAEIMRLQKIEADASVEAESIAPKIEQLKKVRESCSQNALRLADALEKNAPLQVGEKTYSIDELRSKAETCKTQLQTLDEQIKVSENTLSTYQQAVAKSHQKWQEGREVVKVLSSQQELLNSKLDALNASVKLNPEGDSTVFADAKATIETIVSNVDKEDKKIQRFQDIHAAPATEEASLDSSLKSAQQLADELRAMAK